MKLETSVTFDEQGLIDIYNLDELAHRHACELTDHDDPDDTEDCIAVTFQGPMEKLMELYEELNPNSKTDCLLDGIWWSVDTTQPDHSQWVVTKDYTN